MLIYHSASTLGRSLENTDGSCETDRDGPLVDIETTSYDFAHITDLTSPNLISVDLISSELSGCVKGKVHA